MKTTLPALALAAAALLPVPRQLTPSRRRRASSSRARARAPSRPISPCCRSSVMREAATAREALDANNAAMAAVIAAMKEAGVETRDLQTAGIQISPRYTYTNKPDGTQDAVLVGLPGDQHAVGARARHGAHRRDPRQGRLARRQPGRRRVLCQCRSVHGAHRGAQGRRGRRHGQGEDAGRGGRRADSAACWKSPTRRSGRARCRSPPRPSTAPPRCRSKPARTATGSRSP